MRILKGVGVALVFCLTGVGCDGAGDEQGMIGAEDQLVDGVVEIPDACTFLSREEIGAAIGTSVGEGERELQPIGASECVYSNMTSSVTVNTHPSDDQQFDEFRSMIGAEAEPISDIGDEAYFWGPQLIYVRVANRGFSLRINEDLGERLRPAMLELAGAGAAKLRS
jgi:hypothetical protein